VPPPVPVAGVVPPPPVAWADNGCERETIVAETVRSRSRVRISQSCVTLGEIFGVGRTLWKRYGGVRSADRALLRGERKPAPGLSNVVVRTPARRK
jgi:hypothetical protein